MGKWRTPPTPNQPEPPSNQVPELTPLPLVVDLDGTLTATDTLAESVIRIIRRNPADLLRLPFWLAAGRAAFKARIAERADFQADSIPYRETLLCYLEAERKQGRTIILATAAHHSIAERVSAHLGVFDAVIATEQNINLKGAAEAPPAVALAPVIDTVPGDVEPGEPGPSIRRAEGLRVWLQMLTGHRCSTVQNEKSLDFIVKSRLFGKLGCGGRI